MNPRLTAKQREAGMVKEPEKEDFYGKKKAPVKAVVKITKTEKPLSLKQREAGMAEELGKEDFYGAKSLQERMNKDAKEAINKRMVEERTKQIRESMKKNPKGVIIERATIIKKKP